MLVHLLLVTAFVLFTQLLQRTIWKATPTMLVVDLYLLQLTLQLVVVLTMTGILALLALLVLLVQLVQHLQL
jgi:hypothetical protein